MGGWVRLSEGAAPRPRGAGDRARSRRRAPRAPQRRPRVFPRGAGGRLPDGRPRASASRGSPARRARRRGGRRPAASATALEGAPELDSQRDRAAGVPAGWPRAGVELAVHDLADPVLGEVPEVVAGFGPGWPWLSLAPPHPWRSGPSGVRCGPMPETQRAMVPPGVALAVLVGLVVLSPWPFGSAHPRTTQAIAILTLVASLVLLIARGHRGDLRVPHLILWPLVGFWLLACLQLVPLPRPLAEVLAPGPSAVWYPDDAVAAGVLGSGPHPVSRPPGGDGALARVRDRPRRPGPGGRSRAAGTAGPAAGLGGGRLQRRAGGRLRPRRARRLRRQALRLPDRSDHRAVRPLRQQEPLRRVRRDGGVSRGGAGGRARRRGAARARSPRAGSTARGPRASSSPGARRACSSWPSPSRSRAAAP